MSFTNCFHRHNRYFAATTPQWVLGSGLLTPDSLQLYYYSGFIAALLLLYFLAGFVCVDHKVLIKILKIQSAFYVVIQPITSFLS